VFNLDLPYITQDLPGIGGKIRESLEDFIVEEVPLFEPDGVGEHLFVNLTKNGIGTRRLAHSLASLFGLSRTAVGFAGLKDVHSVSTQSFSLLLGRISDDEIVKYGKLIEKRLPVRVNWMKLHSRKLRAGQLIGNMFRINITGLSMDPGEALERAKEIAGVLGRMGIPNFYGPQRVDYENVRRGNEIIKGRYRVRDRWLRRFLVTSYLDYLCNLYLVKRFENEIFHRLLRGDIAKKHSTGGLFVVEDPNFEEIRYKTGEISFTAPIFGPRMWWAEGPSGDLEREVFDESGITFEQLKRLDVRGTRRLGRLLPKVVTRELDRGLALEFFLPKGAYATIVTKEFFKKRHYIELG
jgi:tRNA pseudouridine13 synthase